MQRLLQQVQQQRKEREESLEGEVRRLADRAAEDRQKAFEERAAGEAAMEQVKRELREALAAAEQARGEAERLKLAQSERGLAADQQQEFIERLSKQVAALTKDVREREDAIA